MADLFLVWFFVSHSAHNGREHEISMEANYFLLIRDAQMAGCTSN